jgi:hypothetical protein
MPANRRHTADDWMPSCRCNPPCILQSLASMSRGQLLDYAVEVGGELDMYRAAEDDARNRPLRRFRSWIRRLVHAR